MNKRPFRYGTQAWVKWVTQNPAIDNNRLLQMASELRRAGHLEAMILIHKEIKTRIELTQK